MCYVNSPFDVEPLSAQTLDQALNLIKNYFLLKDDENPELELKEAVSPGKYSEELLKYGIINPKYWVMKLDNKIIGISGIYSNPDDIEDTIWGGWTVCDLKMVNSISICKSVLLIYQVKEAFKTGKKYFKLYTSTLPSESQANKLYEKVECFVYKREPVPNGDYEILFRQVDLAYGYNKYCYPLMKKLNIGF